jgi:hypothetical protein
MKRISKIEDKEESLFLDFIGDSPTTRLIEYLIIGKDFDYTLTDLMNAGLSWSTLNRIFPSFIKNKIVIQTRAIGKIKLYKLNQQNPLVKKLVELFDSIIFKGIHERNKTIPA